MRDRDPDEAAESKLRARSVKGTGQVGFADPADQTANWPCRSCGELVEVGAYAIGMRETMNRRLVATGQQPIDTTEVALCDRCRIAHNCRERAKAEHTVKRVHDAIQVLKGGGTEQATRVAEQIVIRNTDNGLVLVKYWRERRQAGANARTADRALEDV